MKKIISFFVLFIVTFFVFAQPVLAQPAQSVNAACNQILASQGNMAFLLCRVGFLLNALIPILISLGVVYFLWGVVSYMFGKSDEAKKEGKNRIIWGLVGVAVIVSVWGLVAILQNLLFGGTKPTNPGINFCIESAGVKCD